MKLLIKVLFIAVLFIGCSSTQNYTVQQNIKQIKATNIVNIEPKNELILNEVKNSFTLPKRKITLLYSSNKLGKYAIDATNTAMAYLLTQSKPFDLQIIDMEDESWESMQKAIKDAQQKGVKTIVALITNASYEDLIDTDGMEQFDIFLPLVNKNNISKVRKNIIYGGVDYKKQFETLLSYSNRKDIEAEKNDNPWKWDFCLRTNGEGRTGDAVEAFKGADICIAASKPGPNTIKKEWITKMATDPVVFACANPIPEIWPWDAKEAGAKIVGTGRSDFENQINNSLGFPGIFRGVLDVKAKTITDDMCVAAAKELAKFAEERGIHEGDIIPRMDEWEVFPRVAVACAIESINEGLARVKLSKQEIYDRATKIIRNVRDSTKLLMKKGLILPPPEDISLS